MRNFKRTATTVASIAAISLMLSACGGGEAGNGSDGERVSITVSGLPDRSKPEERAAFEGRLEQFQADNPDIDITADETLFDPQVFAAQVAGGTLPTVLAVPPGELPGLTDRKQVREVTEAVEANKTFSSLPDSLLALGRAADGGIYGVPEYAYSIGIMINRAVFEQAGLDPDKPFADWDELRAAAKQITEATGNVGFAVPATEGYGGWLVSSMIPGMGQPVMYQDGEDWTLDLTGESTVEMLELLQAMRWKDGSTSSNSIISSAEISQGLAAGQIGMSPAGGDAYQNMILVNGLPPEDYGMFPMPQGPDGVGTSGGGRISIFRPDATDAEVEAALKWLEFVNFEPYTSEEAAIAWAKARAAEGLPVPEVGLPRVGGDVYDQFMLWIEPYINVPLDQIQPYLDSASTLPIVPDPMYAANEIFLTMDPVIQAVLGREDANIPALLQEAQDLSMPAVERAKGN